MSMQDLASTLVSTKELMGDLAREPMLALDTAALNPSNTEFFERLRHYAPVMIAEAKAGDETTLHRIGVACRLCGDFDLAKLFYIKALEISEDSFGADSTQTAKHRNFLAGLYFVLQKYESAKALIEYSLSVYRKVFGEEHLYTRSAHFALALVYTRLGDTRQAKKHFDESGFKDLQYSNQAQSADRWLNMNIRLFALAALKFEQQQFDESYELFRYCVITEAHEAWPGTMVVARALNNLALLCRAQRLNSEAEEFFRMTLKMKEDIIGAQHADYLNTQNQYRDLLRYMGKA